MTGVKRWGWRLPAGSFFVVSATAVAAIAPGISRAHQLRLSCAATSSVMLVFGIAIVHVRRKMLSIPPLRMAMKYDSAKSTGRLLRHFFVAAFALALLAGVAGIIFDSPRDMFLLVNDGLELSFALVMVAYTVRIGRVTKEVLCDLGLEHYEAAKPIGPPRSAKFLLLLVPRRDREYLIGDLEEEYRAVVLPEYGVRAARFWYWCQVCSSVGAFIWARLRRLAGLVLFLKNVQ